MLEVEDQQLGTAVIPPLLTRDPVYLLLLWLRGPYIKHLVPGPL